MRKRFIQSLLTLIASFLLFIGITLAWILTSLTNEVSSMEIVVDAGTFEYHFYYYTSATFQGNQGKNLTEFTCDEFLTNDCFVEFDETEPNLLATNRTTRPSHQFSFALKVKNISNQNQALTVLLKEILSTNYNQLNNQIQRAFSYQVTKISNLNGSESSDIKDSLEIDYASKGGSIPHFSLTPDLSYFLVDQLVLTPSGSMQTIILYFTITFDPDIPSYDSFNQMVSNSNAFQNQTFQIRKLELLNTPNP